MLAGTFKSGGLEKVQVHLTEYLTRQGIKTTLVARHFAQPVQAPSKKTIDTQECRGENLLHFFISLFRALKQHQPTHVITSANDISCLLAALKLLCFRQMKVIITQHLTVSPEIASAHGLRRLKLRTVKTAMRWLYPRADAIIAVSHGVAEDLSQQTGIDLSAITVIHNPVIEDEASERQSEPSPELTAWKHDEAPIIVFAGRLEAVKRVDILLQAFALIQPESNAKLLILGEGSQLSALKQQANELAIANDVLFLGHHQQIAHLLEQSTVLVLPSDYEGFGNVLVEAMACGIQVIATDCPSGPAEILENGRYGQLIPTGSPTALSTALIKTLNAEVHIPANELKARARHFTVSRAGKAYLDILKGHGT